MSLYHCLRSVLTCDTLEATHKPLIMFPQPLYARFCRKPCSKTNAFNYRNERFSAFNIYFPRSLCTALLIRLFHVLLLVRGLVLYSVRQYTSQTSPEPPPCYDTQLCQYLNQECKFQAIFPPLLGTRLMKFRRAEFRQGTRKNTNKCSWINVYLICSSEFH